MDRALVRTLYLNTLDSAALRPAADNPDAALHSFLTLNAGYFLGEWLSVEEHARLVQRLTRALGGLADLPIPRDATPAAQLAQHSREIEDSFGPRPWTAALVRRTEPLVPSRDEGWDEAVGAAARALAAGGDGRSLLLAHARRRLWQVEHPTALANEEACVADGALQALARAALTADGHTIQVLEAALAEVSANPTLASALLPGMKALVSVASCAAEGQAQY